MTTPHEANWEHVKNTKRSCRYVVCLGEAEIEVQVVPKYVSLHVSGLNPNTKTEQL